MGDKIIIIGQNSITNQSDNDLDWMVSDVIRENQYQVVETIDSCTGWVNLQCTSQVKFYYVIIGTTKAGTAAFPWDPVTLASITTLAQLKTFLNENRDYVWQSIGGMCGGTAGDENVRVEFDAKSKRSLKQGEKLVLAIGCRNVGTPTTSAMNYSYDLTAFFH